MIPVNFRTLTGKCYTFDVDPSSAISDIDFSSKIPDYRSTTKFIYKGANLQNSTKLSSLNLGQKDFIVIYNPTQYQKHPKEPEDLNISIEDEFDEQGQTRIYKSPDHPSVQPLPDISRPTESGVQFVRDVMEPEIAGMSESLYGNPALPQLYKAISKEDFEDEDSFESEDDDDENDNDNEIDNSENENGIYNAVDAGNFGYQRNSPPPQNQNYFGIEGSETLTLEDKQAISRLHNLTNFDEITIVQVFLACNKEENLAANCLLSMMN